MYNSILDDFKNAWNKPNNSLVQIIIINAAVFVTVNVLAVILRLSGNADIFDLIISKLSLPSNVDRLITQPWSLITYFFVHQDFFHVLFNMLFLFWFGRIIMEFLGSKKVISLYVLGGLAGGVFYIIMYNLVPFYAGGVETSRMLGASAGVFAMVVGAAVFMPDYTLFLLFLGPVKIKYIAMVYVLLSFFSITGSNAGGELAHLAGAGMGWLYISQLKSGNDIGSWVIGFMNWVKSFFMAQPKIKVTHKANKNPGKSTSGGSKSSPSKPDQAEIDAILDKISHSGYDSLSKEEKQKLFNASK
ncbi:MAG: rhomboid family intramembrane serine protease [Cyclobacteriaceae bacterium]